jgi:hypothetical protein
MSRLLALSLGTRVLAQNTNATTEANTTTTSTRTLHWKGHSPLTNPVIMTAKR